MKTGFPCVFQVCHTCHQASSEQSNSPNASLTLLEESFPIRYPGLPIVNKKITIAEWEPLYGKVANRVCPWQGRFMSSGAGLILTYSSLSSLHLFTMGTFLLVDGVRAKLDTSVSWFVPLSQVGCCMPIEEELWSRHSHFQTYECRLVS